MTDEGGISAYYRRHDRHFEGKLIPFGSRVRYRFLDTSAHVADAVKFGPDAKVGVFLGYEFKFGGAWNGNCLVADLKCLEDMPLIVSTPRQQCKVTVQAVAEVEPWWRDCSLPMGTPRGPLRTVSR